MGTCADAELSATHTFQFLNTLHPLEAAGGTITGSKVSCGHLCHMSHMMSHANKYLYMLAISMYSMCAYIYMHTYIHTKQHKYSMVGPCVGVCESWLARLLCVEVSVFLITALFTTPALDLKQMMATNIRCQCFQICLIEHRY